LGERRAPRPSGNPARAALVTGASSGLGRCIAAELARRGFDLVITARSAGKLAELAEELERSYRVRAEAVPADLSTLQGVRAVAEAVRAAHPSGLDALVNAAGAGNYCPLRELSDEDIERLVFLNLVAPMLLAKNLLDLLAARRGCVVNVVSLAARFGVPLMQVYVASKAGLAGFTSSLRAEVSALGVRVIGVYPGYMRTQFFERAITGGRRIPRAIMLGAAEPESVARAVAEKIEDARFSGDLTPGLLAKAASLAARLLPGLASRALAWVARSEGD